MLRLGSLFFSVLSLSGCFTVGPRGEEKTSLDRLNGKNYTASVVGPVVVLLRDNQRKTEIRGTVHVNAVFPVPLRFINLRLQSKDQKVNEVVQSDSEGAFQFLGIYPKGSYSIAVESKQYQGQTDFDVSSWEVRDLILEATKAPSGRGLPHPE